jgi:uncharacterized membrane protein YkgB
LYVFFLGFIFFNGLISYSNPKEFSGNLTTTTAEEIATVQSLSSMLMGIAIFFYLLYFGLGAYKVAKYKKKLQKTFDSKQKFISYKAELSQ